MRSNYSETGFKANVKVPDYMLAKLRVPLWQQILPYFAGISAIVGRTAINVHNDLSEAPELLKWLNAASFHILQGFQQSPSLEKADPLLLTADTALGLMLVGSIALGVNKGLDLFRWNNKVREIRKKIIETGNLSEPIGYVNHTVLVAQHHSFLNDVAALIQKADEIPPFLITHNNKSKHNPYADENLIEGEPAIPLWKLADKPYDDDVLHAADINSASKLVVLTSKTDSLVFSNRNEMGLSLSNALNTVEMAYKLRRKQDNRIPLKTLLFLPSKGPIRVPIDKKDNVEYVEYSSAEEYLKARGVPIDQVTIYYIDSLLAEKMKTHGAISGVNGSRAMRERMNEFIDNPQNGITRNEKGKIITYWKSDSQSLLQAKALRGKGHTPLLILDEKKEIGEADDLNYICIQELIEEKTQNFITSVGAERRETVRINYTPLIKAMEGLLPFVSELVLKKAVDTFGVERFLELVELLPRYRADIVPPSRRRDLNSAYHVWKQSKSSREKYSQSNAQRMWSVMDRNKCYSGLDLTRRYYDIHNPSKEQVRAMEVILSSLYNLGLVFRRKRSDLSGRIEYVFAVNTRMNIRRYLEMLGIVKE